MVRPTGEGDPFKNSWFQALVIILVFIGALYLASQVWALLGQFSGIISVFFFSWLLSFILKPLVNLIVDRGASTLGALAIVYVGLLLGVVLVAVVVVPLIVSQLAQIGASIPLVSEQVMNWVSVLQEELTRRNINVDVYSLYGTQDMVAQLKDVGTVLVANGLNLATGLASAFVNIIVILMLSFYMTLDGDRIVNTFFDVVPDQWQEETRFLLDSVDRMFGGFLRGQLIQVLIYGAGTAIIMAIFGLPYIVVASIVAGIVMFIPFFGPFLGIIPPMAIALFTGDFTLALFVLIALLALQQVVTNVIAPKVMSEAVGMHPILVFLAILLGIQIAGAMGAIFGVPVVAVINAMIQLFYNRSASVQKHRARRLGLELSGSAGGDLSFLNTTAKKPGRMGRLTKPLYSNGAKLSTWAQRLWNKSKTEV